MSRSAGVDRILARPTVGAVFSGGWRAERPVVDASRCKLCGVCWLFCPDAAIGITEAGVVIDYNYCKGCGICARECPFKAITMVGER